MLNLLEISLIAYLLGSIPTGYLVGKLHNKDLRKEGSGNIGATNAVRVLGKKWGYLVFAVDFLKGALSVIFVGFLSHQMSWGHKDLLGILAGALAILGHNFPIWLKFQGGKGVSTATGVILVLLPWEVFVTALVVWILVFFTTRYVSLASLLASLSLPIVCAILYWFSKIGLAFVWVGIAICVLVFWRHKSNLSRLMAGTESRFVKKQQR